MRISDWSSDVCSSDLGVNFIDTAEMYPIATSAETYGRTEEIVGNWMQARGNREKVVVATTIVGPHAERFPYIRGGPTRFNRPHIDAAVDTSLQRLKTDAIGRASWREQVVTYV